MSAGLDVGPARDAELDSVLALWAEARSPYARTVDSPDVIARLRENDPGSLLVARLGGRVVGVVVAAWDGWRGNMYRLAVAEAHRRGGIGLVLVRRRGAPSRAGSPPDHGARRPHRRARGRALAGRRLRARRADRALRSECLDGRGARGDQRAGSVS